MVPLFKRGNPRVPLVGGGFLKASRMALVTTSQAAAAILASSASSTTTPVPSFALVLPGSGVPELESNELEQRIGEVVTDAAIEQLGQRWEEGEAVSREEEGDGVNWFATTVSWRWLI